MRVVPFLKLTTQGASNLRIISVPPDRALKYGVPKSIIRRMTRTSFIVFVLLCLSLQACWAFGELFHVHAPVAVHDHEGHSHAGPDAVHDAQAPAVEQDAPLDEPDYHHCCASHSPSTIPPSLGSMKLIASDPPGRVSNHFKLLLLSHRLERPNWTIV